MSGRGAAAWNRARSGWEWARRAVRPVASNVGAREVLAAVGLVLLWRGVGGLVSSYGAEALVGAILVYVGLWHHLVVVNALGAAMGRRRK